MESSQRVVTKLPLRELWGEGLSSPESSRGDYVSKEDLRGFLRSGPVQFVVADVGLPLHWVPFSHSFDFWKNEVAPHLANADEFSLDDFSGGYAYVASYWKTEPAVVLLEKHH